MTFERHVDVDWTGSVMEGQGIVSTILAGNLSVTHAIDGLSACLS